MDIRGMAHALGVVVRDERLDHAGSFRIVHSNPVIKINLCEPEERRRFTLAHELTHWLHMCDPIGIHAVAAVRAEQRSEEYLCDKTAGALLMPRKWLRANYAGATQGLQTLRSIARVAEVSLSAALVRMRDVESWRQTLIQWEKRESGEWMLDGEAGLLPGQRGLVRTSEGTRSDLDRLSLDQWGLVNATLRLGWGPADMRFHSELLIAPRRIIAFLNLPRAGIAGAARRRRPYAGSGDGPHWLGRSGPRRSAA